MMKLKEFYGGGFRKALAIISLLCLLVSFGAVSASAQSAAKIAASSCTVERGDSASVAFNLEGNPGLWGLKFRIHYDHSALTLKSVTTGSVFDKGEFIFSENLNKDPFVIVASGNALENKTANGAIVTLNFTVSSNAAFKAYPVTVEIVQANNVDGDKISISAGNGSVTVVNCKHADKEWRVTAAAECEKAGTETLICKKCGETFDTRAINATGHQHTEIRNAVAATKTAEGYTGDTYCKDCGKLTIKGKTIPKLADDTPTTNPSTTNPPSTNSPVINPSTTNPPDSTDSTEPPTGNEPEMISGTDLIFHKNSKEPLAFVSSADYADFIRVEIDGMVLDSTDYTVGSGSTIVTISADCLNKLESGKHTVSIVSKNGTATAQFTVETETDTSEPVSDIPMVDTSEKSSATPVIIAIVAVVLLAGGAVVFFVSKKRRGFSC